MILYAAGNFEFMGKVEKEMELAELCLEKFGSYNRLSSFFFLKETKNVITVMQTLKGVKDETDQDERVPGSREDSTRGNKHEGPSGSDGAHRIKRRGSSRLQ